MRQIIGVLMIMGGIVLGFYVGFWVCFIGGIVQLINEIKSPEAVVAMNIAWSIVKIVFAVLFGWLSALLLIVPGLAMIKF